jgi:hypothetical protein
MRRRRPKYVRHASGTSGTAGTAGVGGSGRNATRRGGDSQQLAFGVNGSGTGPCRPPPPPSPSVLSRKRFVVSGTDRIRREHEVPRSGVRPRPIANHRRMPAGGSRWRRRQSEAGGDKPGGGRADFRRSGTEGGESDVVNESTAAGPTLVLYPVKAGRQVRPSPSRVGWAAAVSSGCNRNDDRPGRSQRNGEATLLSELYIAKLSAATPPAAVFTAARMAGWPSKLDRALGCLSRRSRTAPVRGHRVTWALRMERESPISGRHPSCCRMGETRRTSHSICPRKRKALSVRYNDMSSFRPRRLRRHDVRCLLSREAPPEAERPSAHFPSAVRVPAKTDGSLPRPQAPCHRSPRPRSPASSREITPGHSARANARTFTVAGQRQIRFWRLLYECALSPEKHDYE